MRSFILAACVLWGVSEKEPHDVGGLSAEKRLIRELLEYYSESGVLGRPVNRTGEVITVDFGLSLIQILNLDEKNQVLSTNVWCTYSWKDNLLTWNASDFEDVRKIRIPSSSAWTPDIKLYNYADMRLEEKREALLVVSEDGRVLWMPQTIFKSSCPIDITYFPFDTQKCIMKFGSWTYNGLDLDLSFYKGVEGFELTDYVESNEWYILESNAVKNVKKYVCCPEHFVDITFYLKLQRKGGFYHYILVLPCVLLSMLTLAIFWIPPESPSKMLLGMNIYVAFFVLLLLLAESTPKAASTVPLLGAYFVLNMILITLSTFLAVIVVNFYMRGEKRNRIPPRLKRVILTLGRLLCMENELHFKTDLQQGLLSDEQIQDWSHLDSSPYQSRPILEENAASISPSVENDVREIRDNIRQYLNRHRGKEECEKMLNEWRTCALVLDRFFFFMYLVTNIIAVSVIFPSFVKSDS